MIKLFTHTDLDGWGCYHMLRDKVGSVEYVGYGNINEEVNKFLDIGEIHLFTNIYITDISVNEATARRLDFVHKHTSMNVKLIDHHHTALWLNKYDWADVRVYDGVGIKTSATTLVNTHSMFNDFRVGDGRLEGEMAYIIDQYDTWKWVVTGCEMANNMNKLFYDNKDEFDSIMKSIGSVGELHDLLNPELNNRLREINKYEELAIKNATMKSKVVSIDGTLVAITHADDYSSTIGNNILKLTDDVGYVVILNVEDNSCSFRSTEDRIDVSEIAKDFGGGGHKCASGTRSEKAYKYFDRLYKEGNLWN